MSLFFDQPPPPLELKLKLASQERQIRREGWLKIKRLRMAIWQELDTRGITTTAAIAAALGMPVAEAQGLLTRQYQEGDVAALEAAAAQLGVPAPWPTRRDAGD